MMSRLVSPRRHADPDAVDVTAPEEHDRSAIALEQEPAQSPDVVRVRERHLDDREAGVVRRVDAEPVELTKHAVRLRPELGAGRRQRQGRAFSSAAFSAAV